ncbi:lycopene cyclase domain-containing protein [Halomarina rubra]|uniref:Lycopene cyclase domain-containing protein n=1 Tax=Halomarina rubra TaxID=2071873 RepID=A0ABD6AU59_9EURY|nr:lycopene cyclase domain-containing protein [Halomarina rubra]
MALSYLGFHLVFVVPALVFLVVIGPRLTRRRAAGIALLASIAFVYTTPWDNYLIAQGVWSYPPDAVLGRVWQAPYEEYVFFLLQPVLTGLWYHRTVASVDTATAGGWRPRAAGVLFWSALAVAGGALTITDAGYYLGAILVWAAPVLAFQWGFGGHALWASRRPFVLAVAVPTLYLWVADAVAIALGIWVINSEFTTGLAPLGLPVEEATFFLVTNLLVVQGLLLFEWVLAVSAERRPTPAADPTPRPAPRQR